MIGKVPWQQPGIFWDGSSQAGSSGVPRPFSGLAKIRGPKIDPNILGRLTLVFLLSSVLWLEIGRLPTSSSFQTSEAGTSNHEDA